MPNIVRFFDKNGTNPTCMAKMIATNKLSTQKFRNNASSY